MIVDKNWGDFKQLLTNKKLVLQYNETSVEYKIWAVEESFHYQCFIVKSSPANTDQDDFETNYKPTANQPVIPKDDYGRTFVRSEGKPIGRTTVFTSQADNTAIGDGKVMAWDFSNSTDEVTAPTGFKRKRIEFQFIDVVNIKDGTVYYHNKTKGSYLDLYVVCPTGEYYLKNDGTLTQAGSDTPISHYVIHQLMQGSVPMGDEVNTETVSSDIPTNYKFWLEITVPDTDATSNGWISIEMYRNRTVVLE